MSPRVRELLEEFAQKIEAELKRDIRMAIDSIGFGLGDALGRNALPLVTPRSRTKGEKRPPVELAALAAKFVAFVSETVNQLR